VATAQAPSSDLFLGMTFNGPKKCILRQGRGSKERENGKSLSQCSVLEEGEMKGERRDAAA
jgi:hypothetical protein